MNTFIFFLALLFLVGCAAAPALQPAGNRTAVQVRSQALTQTAPARAMLLAQAIQPNVPSCSISWTRNVPLSGAYGLVDGQDYSNVWTAVVRAPRLPAKTWQFVTLTQGTNYSEPRTNSSMFFRVYNTNIATGDHS